VVHVRRAFLEVVRVNYWKQINSGKLPRKSTATLALLNSIDVAMEAHDSPGLGDWTVLLQTNRGLFAPPRGRREQVSDDLEVELAEIEMSRKEQQVREKSVFDTMKEAAHEHYAELAEQKEKEKENKQDEDENPIALAAARWRDKASKAREAKRRGALSAFATLPVVDSAAETVNREEASPLPTHINRLHQWRTFLDFRTTLQHLSIATQHDGQVASSNVSHRARPVLNPWTFLTGVLREYSVAKKVYLLTSFIEAHEYAQHKIQFFLRESGMIDQPEENLVVNESREQVRQARSRLAEIDSNAITLQVSKQTARWILHVQEDMVAEFRREGVLLERDAALLLEEVQRDLKRLGSVEWSNIVAAKIAHTLESYVCYPCLHPCILCHAWCGGGHDNNEQSESGRSEQNVSDEEGFEGEETKEPPGEDVRTNTRGMGGGDMSNEPAEFVTVSNSGRTFAV
jgi:hypothetical protein